MHSRIDTHALMIRILVMGAGATGKTSLCLRFTHGTFRDEKCYSPTIEDRLIKQVTLGSGTQSDPEQAYTIELIDSSGQEDYKAMVAGWLSQVDAVMVTYSYDSKSSYERARRILGDQIVGEREYNRPQRASQKKHERHSLDREPQRTARLEAVLVATKSDLFADDDETHAAVRQEGELLASFYDVPFVETSAKTGEDVDEAFHMLIRLVRRMPAHPEPRLGNPADNVLSRGKRRGKGGSCAVM